MSFGLRNAEQTYQRFIDSLLGDLDYITTYIDAIIVASKNRTEYMCHLRKLFQCLQQHGIKIHLDKCIFGADAVDFLGHRVTADGLRLLPQKVRAITDFPQFTTARKLREFWGIINYYHRFIPGAADTLRPLNDMLTGFTESWSMLLWTPEAESAFSGIKEDMTKLTLLFRPSPHAPTVLSTDTLATVGGVILQQSIEGSFVPLDFFSRQLKSHNSAFDRNSTISRF